MALPNGAQAVIGDFPFRLDEDYEQITGRRCYNHYARSLFAGRTNIDGKPGAQNLQPDNLNWQITDFAGEGRVVYDPDNPGLFYRSEGLNMRVPGQFQLNHSVLATTVLDSAAASATIQGNTFTNVSGVSSTSGTDCRITELTDSVEATQNPGAVRQQVDFYMYIEQFADYDTQIAGSTLKLHSGDGAVVGGSFRLRDGSVARTATLSTGTEFGAGEQQLVQFWGYANVDAEHAGSVFVVDVTDPKNTKTVTSSYVRFLETGSPLPFGELVFNPKANHDYQFRVANPAGAPIAFIDHINYGAYLTDNTATISVYDTGPSIIVTQTVHVTANTAGALIGTLIFTGTNANYTYRVERVTGNQAIWVDKVITTAQASSIWALDAMELGLNGDVQLFGHKAATDAPMWTFDETTNTWVKGSAITGTNGATIRALAHSDKFEYALASDQKIYYTNNSTNTAYTTDALTSLRSSSVATGICIAQDRIFAMSEDATNGVWIMTLPVDGTPGTWATTIVGSTQLSTAKNTADLTIRQRMCSTPTGARFFINSSDVTCKVYEVDSSSPSLVAKEIADLGHGVKATAIAYEGGQTFIAGQFVAESDQIPRSALWTIDANGVLQRVLFFRYDNPDPNPPLYIVPYQANIYILQGSYLWRYSLSTGGLFLEYTLSPHDPTQARGLAVMQGRTFALYGYDGAGGDTSEIWVTGTTGNYRQGGYGEANQFISSVYDYGLPGFKKLLRSIQVITDEMTEDVSVLVEYLVDQGDRGDEWVTLGTATSGIDNTFSAVADSDGVFFNTIQIRVTPASASGTFTPTVKAITIKAVPAEGEEFFDLVLLTEAEDSNFRIDGVQEGGDVRASGIVELWRAKTPVTYTDGYAFTENGHAPDYLVTVDDFRDERTALGEGRVVVTLRVLL